MADKHGIKLELISIFDADENGHVDSDGILDIVLDVGDAGGNIVALELLWLFGDILHLNMKQTLFFPIILSNVTSFNDGASMVKYVDICWPTKDTSRIPNIRCKPRKYKISVKIGK